MPEERHKRRKKSKTNISQKEQAQRVYSKAGKTTRLKITGWRLWLFRFIALIVIPALLFLLLEVILRITGYGFPARAIIECKAGGKSIYCNNFKFSWRFFPRYIARVPAPFVFSKDKTDSTYRVFVLGESAAAGEPDEAYCFGRILQAMLRHRYPQANFEVITTAIAAINSHVILEIAEDCARHDADLFVAYMGNNEVVGPYGAGTVFAPLSGSLSFIRFDIAFKSTKVGQLLTSLAGSLSQSKDTPKVWRGMEMFLENQVREDDPRLESVYRHFERNIQDIKDIARQSGARIIFCTVGSNLKDCPPFASLHRPDLTDTEKESWNELYQQGIICETDANYAKAVEWYLAAAQIDECYADLQFRLGKCYWSMGEYDRAKERYILARELDTLRFRADTRINEIIRRTSADRAAEGVYLVDAVKIFENKSPYKTAGEELFYEHVHLNFEGNYLLAKAVFEQVEKILPERIKNQKESIRQLLTETECAQNLAYTDWDKYKIADNLLNEYIKKAPFTNQLYHKEQVEQMEQKLKEYKNNLTPQALEKASGQYRSAIEDNKEDWFLRQKYGELLDFGLEDYRAAAEQYSMVLEYIDYYGIHAILSGLLGKLGDLDAAIDHSLRALQINPVCITARSNLAMAYEKKGQIDKAIEQYYQTLRALPNHVIAYHNLGILLCKQGKVDEAVTLYRNGLAFMPDSVVMHFNLGCLLIREGQKQEAIEELRAALQIDPNSIQAREMLKKLLNESD
jgi:tetratricopeptide (TPR) repeat protein